MRVHLGFIILALLAACATAVSSDDRAWSQIDRVTAVTYLGNNRLEIVSQKPLAMGTRDMERAMLARAAGETLRRGGEAFAIVKVDYGQRLSLPGEEYVPLGRTWIGTYESLLMERERDTEAMGRVTSARYIVRMLPKEDVGLRQSFDADETYSALVDAWIEEKRL